MDHNQRTSKNRSHDSHKQTVKKLSEDLQQKAARQGSNTTQSSAGSAAAPMAGVPDFQFVNNDFKRQPYGVVAGGGTATSAKPMPGHVKLQRGSDVYHSPSGQVMILRTDKEGTPSPLGMGEPPPSAMASTTKSSSLSRDISPSRITAQVAQVMSESTGQPLLLSALTGKMPSSLVGVGGRMETVQEQRQPNPVDGSSLRTSPYRVPEQRHSPSPYSMPEHRHSPSPYSVAEHRHSPSQYSVPEHRQSPLLVEHRAPLEGSEGKVRPMPSSSMPFESLMRAAALAQAQENFQISSSPGRQQLVVQSLSPSRNQTPSPKPVIAVAAARSPQRHTGQQGQRRSPVAPASRSSPGPPPNQNQDVMAAISAAISASERIPAKGLVQQHLLSTSVTTTAAANRHHTKPVQPFSRISTAIPAAPAVPSARATPPPPPPPVKLSTTVAVDTAGAGGGPPFHRAKGGKNSHVSIGTGTDSKQYASHGAQTKKNSVAGVGGGGGENSQVDVTSVVENLTVKHGGEGAAVGGAFTFQPHNRKEWGSQSQGARASLSVAASAAAAATSRVGGSRVTSLPSAVASALSSGRAFASVAPSSSSSSIVVSDVCRKSGGSVPPERKRHNNNPVPAAPGQPASSHSHKPVAMPSSHPPHHSHIHRPSPHPRHQAAVISSAAVTAGSVNHVLAAATPISTPRASQQPLVGQSRPSTTSSSVAASLQTTCAARVKQEPTVVSVSNHPSSSSSSSAHYQPHHHRYHQSQPAQTITSQSGGDCGGPVVKDFIPVSCSPEPPPYHPQPPLPPHVNPFTFPTSGIKIHFPTTGDGPSYSLTPGNRGNRDNNNKVFEMPETKVFEGKKEGGAGGGGAFVAPPPTKSLSDVTGLRQPLPVYEAREGGGKGEEMPLLKREGFHQPKHGAFNHVGASKSEFKGQLPSPFNMRLQNLSNFPTMATAYRSAYRSHSVALQRAKAGSITSAAKSLDLLRQNVQKNINKELNDVVQRYVEKFFRPAADNIRINNGSNSVSEDHINAVCRQILEEAKRVYSSEARRSATPVTDFPDNISETGSLNGRRVSPIPSLKRVKASDSDSEKASENGLPRKVPRRKGRPPLNSSGRSTPVKPLPKEAHVKREGPKWDPDRIKPESHFVMGARANKALGLGNTRGRLYIRHPDIFKYSGDQDDKVWLHEQKLMPATGGKAYMLLVEDIVTLSQSEDYRDSPMLMMNECRGFEVPQWMQVKIKAQMQAQRSDLAQSSRSLSRSPPPERPEPPKTLPFSNFSDSASNNDMDSIGNKNSLQTSPVDTEEMDFLSTVDNDDNTQPSDVSPFNVTGGFEDAASRSPSSLDPGNEDQSLTTPFT